MKHGFTLLFFFFSFSVLAQRDFRPGFVIPLNGDTLRGQVAYSESQQRERVCFFKAAPKAAVQRFTPEEVLGYGFNDDRVYRSVQVRIDSSRVLPVKVFAWSLVEGRVDLLKIGALFYAQKEGMVYALVARREVVQLGGRTYSLINRQYAVFLQSYLFADCPDEKLPIQETEYGDKALIQLFEQYNRCAGGTLVRRYSAKPWTKLEGSLLGGIQQGTVTSPVSYTDFASFRSAIAPIFGVQLGVSSPRLSEHFSFQTGLFYRALHLSARPEALTAYPSRSEYFYQFTTLQLPVLLRYRLFRRPTSLFFQAGAGFGFNTTKKAWYITESELNKVVSIEHGDLLPALKNTVSVLAGIGVQRSLFHTYQASLEVRYERHADADSFVVAAPSLSSTPLSTFSLLVGIGFW